jgi:hypothetical protein
MKAADDDSMRDQVSDYKGEGGERAANNNGIRPAGQRARNKNKEIEITQKDFFSAIRSVRVEFLLPPKTNYPPFRFISLIFVCCQKIAREYLSYCFDHP